MIHFIERIKDYFTSISVPLKWDTNEVCNSINYLIILKYP